MIPRLILPLLALIFYACATINSAVEGVVVDTTTNHPIPGTFVIAQWIHHGSDPVGSRTEGPHLVVVQADGAGTNDTFQLRRRLALVCAMKGKT